MKPVRNQELEEAIQNVESDPKINLLVPSQLKNPHSIAKGLNSPAPTSNKYNRMTNLVMSKRETFDLIVGKTSFNRAILILDTFVKAIEGRGHQIICEEENTFIEAFGEKLRIRLWEKSRYIDQIDKYSFRDKELTGNLSIQYFRIRNYVEREWCDSSNTKLEEKLGRVIGNLEYFAQKEKTERLEREKRWQEERIREALIKERNSQKESDFNNFKTLLSNSLRWEKAQSIRAYIRHIQEYPNLYAGPENLNDWINWAMEKADWFDPTISKPDSLLNPFGEFHEALLNQTKQLDRYNFDKL